MTEEFEWTPPGVPFRRLRRTRRPSDSRRQTPSEDASEASPDEDNLVDTLRGMVSTPNRTQSEVIRALIDVLTEVLTEPFAEGAKDALELVREMQRRSPSRAALLQHAAAVYREEQRVQDNTLAHAVRLMLLPPPDDAPPATLWDSVDSRLQSNE